MHRIRKVIPDNLRVVGLSLENLVCLVTYCAIDVVGLGRSTCRVYHHNTSFADVVSIQSTRKKFVVRTVHRVAALECNYIHSGRKLFAHFTRSLAGKVTNRLVQSFNRAGDVVFTLFHGNHHDARVLDGRGSIACYIAN